MTYGMLGFINSGANMKNVIRFMCLITGVLFAALAIPFSLLSASAPQGENSSSPISIILSFGSIFALNALSLLYVGVVWDGIKLSRLYTVAACVFLLAPFGSGVALIIFGHKEFFLLAGWLLFISVAAFFIAVLNSSQYGVNERTKN
jgi:hypothetical protein